MNDAKADITNHVQCSTEGAVTTIATGDDSSGTTSAVDTSASPVVQFAQIRDVGGFTGSFWAELDPDAEVTITGRTFLVKGKANGFNESNPSARVSQPFSIRVAC